MRRDKDIRQIALQISIALSAGVFSIMPSASAAPVLDHVVSGGAVVDQKTSPQVTDVTSNTRNNVIDWKDFSVSQGETVRFDKGEKINNYLNVVSGVNTSHIDGAIKGGDNVYIVNPNGVVFGNSASVDVGSLYVSSRPLDDVNYTKVDTNGDMQPLADTASMKGGDIVNMGSVQANSVFVEGGNIIITDVDKIKTADGSAVNNNVTIQTEGKITLARDINTVIAEQKAQAINTSKADSISFASVADGANSQANANTLGSNYTYTFGNAVAGATSINNELGLYNLATQVSGNNPITGDYMLTADLDFKKFTTENPGKAFVPIGSASNVFSGNFDGQYHTVSGITVSGGTYGGLFGYTSGGTIENIGVSTVNKDGEIVGGSIAASYAGGIAGYSDNTTFENIFNEGVSITGTDSAGGLIGYLNFDSSGTLTTAYNTGAVIGEEFTAGGIAGTAQNATISNVYNIGSVTAGNGFVGQGSIKKIANAYTTESGVGSVLLTPEEDPDDTNVMSGVTASLTSINDYSKLSSISAFGNDGTVNPVTGVNDNDTVWRIYEGQSLPLLRAFLTAHGTVTVDYTYTHGTDAVNTSKGSGDLTVIYNGSDITLDNVNYSGYQYKDANGRINSTATGTPTDIIVSDGLITKPASVGGKITINGNITDTNYDSTNQKVRTLAAFYTGQQGYDLVGNNYTIKQKAVTIDSSTVTTAPYSREYNGTNDATDAIKNFSYGGADGIVDGDIDAGKVSIDTSGVNAYFVGSNGNITDADAPDVGLGDDKIIALTGGVTIQNAAGYYNYILTGSASFGDESNPTTFGGNSITPKKITVNLTNPTGINKQYDGGTDVKGNAYLPEAQFVSQAVNYTVSGAQKTETVNFNTTGITANYVDADDKPVATADTYDNKVKYSGIAIASVTNGKVTNYELVDAQENTIYFKDKNDVVSGTGSLYGSGKISRIKLDNTGFSWYKGTDAQTATREYNMSSIYTEPVGTGDTKYTVDSAQTAAIQDDLTFTVTGANFLKTINASDTAVNAGDAHYVGYTVAVSGDAAVNYTFGDNDEPIGSSVTLFGEGSITPRTIKLDVASGRSADKMYDAGTVVLDAADQSSFIISEDSTVNAGFNDGNATYHLLDYTDGDDYKLLDDGAKIVYSGVYKQKGTEGDANVYFVDDQVASKNITYTATIENANGNYVFDNNTTSKTFTNGVGKITQREITNLYFTDVNKTYDTTADVNHDDIAVDVGTGDNQVKLYGEDTAATVFDMDKVTGVYVHKAANKQDADVENEGNAKSKTITYTLQDGFLTNNNYKLADNIGTTVNGDGAIQPITLNDKSKLVLDVSGVTKVYDGDNKIKGPQATATDYDSDAFIGENGLVYALDDDPDHNITLTINSVQDAYYDSENSSNGTPQRITYELAISGDSSGNYALGNGLLTDGYLKWNKDVTGWSDAEKAKMTGVITKADLTAALKPAYATVEKVYDGKTSVKDSNKNVINGEAINFTGWLDDGVEGRTKTVAASYDNKNVGDNKDVNYVITLDSTSQGNYNLYVTNKAGKTVLGNTAVGSGKITPATLTVTFMPNPVNKTYDGEKAFTGEVTPTYTGIQTDDNGDEDVVALKKFTTAAGERYYSAAEFDTADKGTNKNVYYTVELDGTDKGNYVLANSETVDNVTTMTGKGTISPKELSDSDIKISFADIISKVYDATNNVAFDHTGDGRYFDSELGNTISATAESYVNNLTVGGVTLTMGDNGDYKVYSAHYNSAGVDANKATYVFTLQGNKLDNFDMTHLSSTLYDQTNKRLTLATDSATNTINTTSVSITKKLLQASLNDTVLDLERVYNGTTNLPVTVQAASKVTVTGFVNDNEDTTAFDDSLVNGRYVDRNVAYDAAGNVTTKDVLFDVNLKGTGAENYVINNTNANSTTLTGANLGKITPKDLTVDFVYTDKVYNNNSAATVTGVTLDGRQTGDTALTLDTDTIVAEFGSKTGDTFTANGDVNYLENATDHEGYKGVQYSNLQAAMKAGFGTITAGNYTIADTVYFDEAAKKGKIKRLALVQSDIKTNWDTVTKEYDGTYAAPEGKLHIYTDKTGENIDLAYVLQDTDGAVYDNQQINVVQGADVTYTLNSLEAKEFKNFVMTEELMNSFNGKTYKTTGNITPRVLKINLNQASNWVKTYDGTDAVKDATGAVVNSFDFTYQKDHNILDDDANTVNLVVTGAYVDADANIEPENTATTGKGIKYTLKLTGNDDGNYTLDSTNTTVGAVIETDDQTYTGDGAIKKRIVYAAFDDSYGTGIDRDYAGANDTSADASKTVRNHINLVVSTGGDTGLLDNDVTLKHDDISANYASANVSRNQQTKEVQAQDVYFTNFTLQDAGSGKSGNYAVRVNDSTNPNTLVGKGTIKPIKVTVGLIAVPKKDYDGTTGIEATYLANDNFTFTPAPVIASEDVANDIVITGAYKNANAGSKDANYADKEYTYSLTLNNDNYELMSGDDNGRTVTATNYGTKATLAGADGIIEARTISLASIADMTKVYDGTTDADTGYMNNLEKNITFNNVVNNESLKLTGTAVYNDDANASDVETTAKPKKHQVKYTVNIGNTNYRLDDGTQYGTQDLTAYGDGYINRRTLSLVATPTSVNVGESMPAFTGTVTGFAGNEATLYSDFISYVKDNFKAADGANTSTPGSYGVYGWYMGNKTGLLGLNYQFDQAPANATAFTVNYVNNNTGNPDTKITPNNNIYHQISKDMNSGFGDNGAAAIEYKDKSGKVLGTEKIDSGEINSKGLMIGGGTDMSKQADSNANIGIAGGDIVNMEGANAAGSVNIETNGEGTVVNLEVFSIDGEKQSETNNSTAEITNMDSQNGMASIEIRDEKQNIIGEDVRDKKDEKEGEIAIKSSNGKDDEIELTVEKQGVNVA